MVIVPVHRYGNYSLNFKQTMEALQMLYAKSVLKILVGGGIILARRMEILVYININKNLTIIK